MAVGDRLKNLRKEKSLSVARLGELSGVSRPYIAQIESGRRQNPSGEKLQMLATALGVTIADLLGSKEGIPSELLEEIPASLREFVRRGGKKLGIQREDVEMLKHVHFRGRRPESPEDWELIFSFLRRILG